eukprot:9417020-Alexandrium_andersonii.AAC.1
MKCSATPLCFPPFPHAKCPLGQHAAGQAATTSSLKTSLHEVPSASRSDAEKVVTRGAHHEDEVQQQSAAHAREVA